MGKKKKDGGPLRLGRAWGKDKPRPQLKRKKGQGPLKLGSFFGKGEGKDPWREGRQPWRRKK